MAICRAIDRCICVGFFFFIWDWLGNLRIIIIVIDDILSNSSVGGVTTLDFFQFGVHQDPLNILVPLIQFLHFPLKNVSQHLIRLNKALRYGIQLIVLPWPRNPHRLCMEIQLLFVLLFWVLIDHILNKLVYGFWVKSVHDGHVLCLDDLLPVQEVFLPLIVVIVHRFLDQLLETWLYQQLVFLVALIINRQVFYKRRWTVFL